jgi:hypothetical protein
MKRPVRTQHNTQRAFFALAGATYRPCDSEPSGQKYPEGSELTNPLNVVLCEDIIFFQKSKRKAFNFSLATVLHKDYIFVRIFGAK